MNKNPTYYLEFPIGTTQYKKLKRIPKQALQDSDALRTWLTEQEQNPKRDKDEPVYVECKSVLKDLVGRTIITLELGSYYDDDPGSYLRFTDKDGYQFIYHADGNSCSSSYINDILNVKDFLNNPILNILDRDLEDRNKILGDYDHHTFYGVTIQTLWTPLEIVYRNESNGYYGGHLTKVDEVKSGIRWVVVTDDMENIA